MNYVMISIIIPVYNAEKYINQCIDSILEQTYPYFELICVDDGSTDQSYEILKEYAKQDSRVNVIRQKNQYAGVARNRGMEIAKGKYILFLDSDDFFCEDMLEKLVDKAEREQSEIVVFDAFQYDNLSQKVVTTAWKALSKVEFEEEVKSAKDIRDSIFSFTVPAPWNKLFLLEFVRNNNLLFQPIKRTNDLCFVYSALSVANRISILNEKLVYYRDNNSLSLQGKGEETPEIFVEALMGLKQHLLVQNIWEDYKESFESMAISVAFYNLNNMKNKECYLNLCKTLKHKLFSQLITEENKKEDILIKELKYKKDIIIYGAGAVAKSLVNYLLFGCNYEKEKIVIVVSNASQNIKYLYDIPIRAFDELRDNKKIRDKLLIIAINEKQVQQEIMKKVRNKGFAKIKTVEYKEIISIINKEII